MKQSKRLLSAIILAFIISCFLPVQSYAISDQSDTDKQTAAIGKTAVQDKEVKDEDDKVEQQDKDIDQDKTNVDDNNVEDDENTEDNKNNVNNKDNQDDKKDENLWYSKKNPMKKEHQKLLWDYCTKRNLDYIDMLSLIYTESNFNEKCSSGKCYGYFQISGGNCKNLADTLKTKNKPLDGAININWGTTLYSWILTDKRVKDLEGKKKRDVALSIYQRGTGGYDKYGINTNFLKIFYKKRAIVSAWFEEED